MTQNIHTPFFLACWYTTLKSCGVPITDSYAWQTCLSFALAIILLPRPWQKWQKPPKATSPWRASSPLPLPINTMPISYFTSRFKICLGGEDRVCALGCQLTRAKNLANHSTLHLWALHTLNQLCSADTVKEWKSHDLFVSLICKINDWLEPNVSTNAVFMVHLLERKEARKFR